GSTEENLASSFESETKIAEVAYGEYVKEAEKEGNNQAVEIFSQSRDVEDVHAKLYKKALNHMVDESETTYYVCKVCGYVSDAILPDDCPVCGAKKEQFETF
ncbi:MAG: ferritin family protein, partial [Spirochaetota bacterium]|nr:ferritin family protein [Spirochaetota bacterium]